MSGFVAVVRLDGSPVDRAVLEKLVEPLRLRGPDGERIWVDGCVGFAHTMFRTTFEAEHEVQPCSLDGSVWIAGDIRVDGREDLRDKLSSFGRDVPATATDPELVLHSYLSWGEDCVDHLLGDFSFAIWDSARQKLFWGRDQLGVRGAYYAKVGQTLVISNSLRCVRAHPDVSCRFNDSAICDFLLFGCHQDHSTTCFSDVERLPPGHTLTWSDGQLKLRRYWTLPIEEPILYRRSRQYVEHFRDLLRTSITDRLRTNKVGIYMSGGLDSSLLAATTKQILANRSEGYDLRAYTCVYDSLIPDQERHYAGMVATHLAIPIHFQVVDGYQPFEGLYTVCSPEPVHDPFHGKTNDSFREVVAHSRVAFYGEGPDNLLLPEGRRYLSYLLQQRRYWRAAEDLLRSFLAQPRIPVPRRWRGSPSDRAASVPPFPDWIRSDVAKTYELRERWERYWKSPRVKTSHPLRAASWASMHEPLWQRLFTHLDPDWGGFPLEFRHPYLDIRIVRFLLAIPSLPWCQRKFLLRAALEGVVPHEIQWRPKTSLSEDTFLASRRKGWRVTSLDPPPEALRFIEQMPDLNSSREDCIWLDSAALSLSLWIQNEFPVSINALD